jgi:hypothetical protein
MNNSSDLRFLLSETSFVSGVSDLGKQTHHHAFYFPFFYVKNSIQFSATLSATENDFGASNDAVF